MDETWADAAWKGLESQGWEEMKLSATNFFYISPAIDSVDAFQKNATAFGSKGEAVIFALQNTTAFEHILPHLWEHMRCTLGWQLFVRRGQVPWYVMPNIDTFELCPKVNLFESMIDAVEAYLAPVTTNIKRKQAMSPPLENSSKRHKTSPSDATVVSSPSAASGILPVYGQAPSSPSREASSLEAKTKLVTEDVATPTCTSSRTSRSETPASTPTKRLSPRAKTAKEPSPSAADVKKSPTTKATPRTPKSSTGSTPPGATTSRSSMASTKSTLMEKSPQSLKVPKSTRPKTPIKAKSASKPSEFKEDSPVDSVITSTSALYLKNLSTKLGSVVSRKYAGPDSAAAVSTKTVNGTATPKKTEGAEATPSRRGLKNVSVSTPSSRAIIDSSQKTPHTPRKRNSKLSLFQDNALVESSPVVSTTPPPVHVVDVTTPSPTQPTSSFTVATNSSDTEPLGSVQVSKAATTQSSLVPSSSKPTKSPIIPGSAQQPSPSVAIHLRRTPPVVATTVCSNLTLSSTPKTKNQTQLDSINDKLVNTSPMTTSSLFSVLDLLGTPPHTIPSPAASSAISCERKKAAEVTITTPNWALESPGKASKRPWNVVVGTSTNPSTPKKRRNAALISTILSCDQSPLAGKSDESMASFLEETVCDEPSPVQPAPCSKSMPSSQNVYTAVGVDDILNKAMKQLDSKGTQPVPELSTSYVTPHVVDKTQPRMQSPIKAGREVSFRTKVIQQFSHGGWRSVAPKLSDKGSYTYTHDKLNDSVRFTRDELLSYANDHDIFRNPALMDPHMVMRVIKHGGQHQRKAPKSFKHRPSSEWSPIIV